MKPQVDLTATARKLTLVLFSAQALGSAGFIAAATVASIVGANLSGRTSWAGVPTGVYLFGSAFAAPLWGVLMDRYGRRGGIALGLVGGMVGAGLAAGAVVVGSFWLLVPGLVLMGSAHAALQLGRFVAAEVSPPAQRGRAVANVVLGGTVGAVVGPLMIGPLGGVAARAGLPELTGAYAGSLVMFVLAAIVITLLLRPEPRLLALELAARQPEQANPGAARPLSTLIRLPAVFTAITAMVVGQAVMVMLMVITALHMAGHHHPLTSISAVISSHTLGMYAFSVVTGQLTDRFGRGPVILLGSLILLLSALLAPLSVQFIPLAVALFLLGLGWNLCFVGGSALLADQLAPAERARTQGLNDLLIGLTSAGSSVSSGVIFAGLGYGIMGGLSALASLIPIALTTWWWLRERRLKGVPVRSGVS